MAAVLRAAVRPRVPARPRLVQVAAAVVAIAALGVLAVTLPRLRAAHACRGSIGYHALQSVSAAVCTFDP